MGPSGNGEKGRTERVEWGSVNAVSVSRLRASTSGRTTLDGVQLEVFYSHGLLGALELGL